MSRKTVMIVAGETSGDLHGSEIARFLHSNNVRCIGMGSDHMRNAGVELLYDSAGIAVVGLWEVLTHWSDIQTALRTLQDQLLQQPPDLLLLIDYQEFNLKLAAFAKQHGVRVLFYISPQLWAWRPGRIKKFVHAVDMMAVIFPFEVPYFEKAGIPVRYVGHPLANKVSASADRVTLRREFALREDVPVVALLPGSRLSEIRRMLPIMLQTAVAIRAKHRNVQFILPVANRKLKEMIKTAIAQAGIDIVTIDGRAYDAAFCSEAAIVTSGTATLEVALLQVPMAIIYKVSSLSYAIFRRLIKVPFVGLANIVAGRQVAPEFIQQRARAELIAEDINTLLSNPDRLHERREQLRLVTDNLGDMDGLHGISELALSLLND